MFKIIIISGLSVVLVLGASPLATARDLCCFGRTEKNVTGPCVVTNFQEGRICIEEVPNSKAKECWGVSGCFQLKDHGSAKIGDRVIVTGWRAGDMKCYQGSNCGKVIVIGGGASK